MIKFLRAKLALAAGCSSTLLLAGTVSAFAQNAPQIVIPHVVLGDLQYVPAPPPDAQGADYGAKGLPLGSFRLFPTFDAGVAFDDNIFKTETNESSDTIFELTPRAELQSNWSQHYLSLHGGLTRYENVDFDSESRTDWDIGAEGRIDVQRGIALLGGTTYRETYEPRESPDQLNIAAEPTPFSVFHADARIEAKPTDFGVTAGVQYDEYAYDPTKLNPTGVSSNTDRDYHSTEAFGRLSYEFSPGYSIFGHVSFNWRDHDTAVDRNGVNRDSDGYRINGGLEMEFTQLVRGEFFLGYLDQQYKSPLGDETGLNFGASIIWDATPLIRARLAASHLANETVVSHLGQVATDSDEQRIDLGVDYAFRRNIVLHGDLSYLNDDFSGTKRTDDVYAAGVAGTYLINEYMNASASYTYSERSTSATNQDYSDNIFRLVIGFQL